MLRKLIVLAVTTGLAKKAYDMYMEKGSASGVTDVTARRPRSSNPPARTTSSESSKPSAM
jgi:hypothetical protein